MAMAVFAVQKKQAATAGWMKDLPAALAKAKKTGQLVMVDFNATWCGPCQLYKQKVFLTAEFKNAAKNVILVEIDTDDQPAIARKYGVNPIPDIRFFSPKGKQVDQVIGYIGPELTKKLTSAKRKI